MRFEFILTVETDGEVYDFDILENPQVQLNRLHDAGSITEYEYSAIREEIKRLREAIKEK